MCRAIESDRECRRQVRRAFYLRPQDFSSEREYNDYLEEFEDLVEQMMADGPRAMAARLDELRATWATQTARNVEQHDAERRKREDTLEQERLAALRAAQERREAEQRELEAKLQRREALQNGICAGTTTLDAARADMARAAAQPTLQPQPQGPAQPGQARTYVPASRPAPQAEVLVQPLDAAAAAAVAKRAPAFMLSSLKAQAEAYESDPAMMQRVCAAGGCDRELWRSRYQQEAFCSQALFLVVGQR